MGSSFLQSLQHWDHTRSSEGEKWPALHLCTDSGMVGNALWGGWNDGKGTIGSAEGNPSGLLDRGKTSLPRGEVGCESPSYGCSRAQESGTEEHRNNREEDGAARIKVSQLGLDWPHKGELFLDTSGHQGRDATSRWAHEQGVGLTMDTISRLSLTVKRV